MGKINPGLAVLVHGGSSQWRGRIGLAVGSAKRHRWRVLFAPSGQTAFITEHNLRPARRAEVVDAGMYGVGFEIIDECWGVVVPYGREREQGD